jgi:hypothetical protein
LRTSMTSLFPWSSDQRGSHRCHNPPLSSGCHGQLRPGRLRLYSFNDKLLEDPHGAHPTHGRVPSPPPRPACQTQPQHHRVGQSPSSHTIPPHWCIPVHESFPDALPMVLGCSSHQSHYTTSPLPSPLAIPLLAPWVWCPAPARAPL